MFAALIIVFREVIEAGLIVGIVLAATRTVAGSRRWIFAGITGGVAGSAVVALFTGTIASAFAGSGQELFNAAILAFAVVMLIWHNVWMASHGRDMSRDLRRTGQEVTRGEQSLLALALVVGIAVLREGSEIVLFLYGIAITANGSAAELFIGGLAGLLMGAALSALTYFGLLKVPTRHLFTVTGAMISLLAAGLAAQSTHFLEQAGVLTALDRTAWDTSAILSDGSIPGRVLHTLIGYSDRPSIMQVIVYLVTLATIYALSRAFAPRLAAAT